MFNFSTTRRGCRQKLWRWNKGRRNETRREGEEREWKKKSKSIETSRMFLKGRRSARANVRPVFSLHIKLARSVGKARKTRRKNERKKERTNELEVSSSSSKIDLCFRPMENVVVYATSSNHLMQRLLCDNQAVHSIEYSSFSYFSTENRADASRTSRIQFMETFHSAF